MASTDTRADAVLKWAAFFMCLTLLMLVVGLVIDDIGARSDKTHSDRQVAELTTLVRNQNVELSRQTTEFAGERTQLLDSLHIVNGNLQEAVAYARAQALRDEAVLIYLRRIGVHLPQSLLTPIPAPTFVQMPSGTSSRAVTGQASKSHGKGHKK